MNVLEGFDLSTVEKVPKAKRSELSVIPVREYKNNIYCIYSDSRDEDINYLKYLYGKEIILEEVPLYKFESLKESIELNKINLDLENKIISKAIVLGASDIHFEPSNKDVRVRLRINGELITFFKIKKEIYKELTSRLKIQGNMDMTEKRIPQDGKFNFKFEENNYSIRVSTIPLVFGEKIALRLLYKKYNYKIEGLKLNLEQEKILKKIVRTKGGMVLISGPTGSGKSSTLYTILEMIKNNDCNITTIEDPVEVIIENTNQISLDRKAGLGFAEGLRSILRQDPDVIMVGEIRDEETAKIAVRAAITGHKVYSTIHTRSSREVFARLEEMDVKSYLIKDALVGLISQRLVKTLCKDCKVEDSVEIKGKKMKVFKECGCENCNYTGISGRVLVSAIHYIENDKSENIKEILNKNKELYLNTQMEKRLKELLIEGEVSISIYNDFIKGEELGDVI